MNREIYLDQRVDHQLNWMKIESARCKRKYVRLKAAEIIAAATIPFFAGYSKLDDVFPLIVSLLGVLIIILSGLQQLNRYYESWIRYRGTAETLKKEKFLFLSGTSPYDDTDEKIVFNKFVANIEAVLGSESAKWQADFSKQPTRDE